MCNSGAWIAAIMGMPVENNLVMSEEVRFANRAREDTRLAWLALAMSPGLGPKRIADAMRQVESANRYFVACH